MKSLKLLYQVEYIRSGETQSFGFTGAHQDLVQVGVRSDSRELLDKVSIDHTERFFVGISKARPGTRSSMSGTKTVRRNTREREIDVLGVVHSSYPSEHSGQISLQTR